MRQGLPDHAFLRHVAATYVVAHAVLGRMAPESVRNGGNSPMRTFMSES